VIQNRRDAGQTRVAHLKIIERPDRLLNPQHEVVIPPIDGGEVDAIDIALLVKPSLKGR
jgi:hypothetical protein